MVVRGVASWSQEDVESEDGEGELVFQHLHGPPAIGFVWSKPRSVGSLPVSCLPAFPFDLMCFSLVSDIRALTLMCSRWFNRTGSGSGRECWGRRPFPINRFHELSAAFKWALGKPGCPASARGCSLTKRMLKKGEKSHHPRRWKCGSSNSVLVSRVEFNRHKSKGSTVQPNLNFHWVLVVWYGSWYGYIKLFLRQGTIIRYATRISSRLFHTSKDSCSQSGKSKAQTY